MGLASLRQYQANTLRRSEECLTTSSPNSSASDSEVAAANGGDHQRGSNLILDQQPVRKFRERSTVAAALRERPIQTRTPLPLTLNGVS